MHWPQMDEGNGSRWKPIMAGALLFAAITCLSCGLLFGWRFVPGLAGEWLGMLAGIISTPFFLEASFFALGALIVVLLNHWRLKREGDEFVYLEEVAGPDVPHDLPDRARWAVYTEPPLAGEEPALLSQVEGALAIGDLNAAAETIAEMSEEELRRPETLALRLELARMSGNHRAEERLRREIAELRQG